MYIYDHRSSEDMDIYLSSSNANDSDIIYF